MELNEISNNDNLYTQALTLRYKLFFESHGLPRSVVFDDNEPFSQHVALSEHGELIAYGRLTQRENGECQITQMVVTPEHQSQGYGSRILNALMEMAERQGAKRVVLNARTTATGRYQKYGFTAIGPVYKSHNTGVPHIKMAWRVNAA